MRSRPLLLLSLGLAGCGSVAAVRISASRGPRLATWSRYIHVQRPLDLAPGPTDHSLVVAAAGRLFLLRGGSLAPYVAAYQSPGGEEPYIAVPSASHRGCGFGRNAVYAIRLQKGRGVTRISPNGGVRQFARISAPGLIDGIAFDESGAFGYRLLVTINHGTTSTVDAITCNGTVSVITRRAPRVEGGIVVAPLGFGRFGGDLIAPDETGGRLFAVAPSGKSKLLANSGLPHGGDIGVESETFVPPDRHATFYLADRLTPGNRHPGDNVLLRLDSAALQRAGVQAGDLLVATEGGALTDAVHCGAAGCSVRFVANGPTAAHAEGHIGFVR